MNTRYLTRFFPTSRFGCSSMSQMVLDKELNSVNTKSPLLLYFCPDSAQFFLFLPQTRLRADCAAQVKDWIDSKTWRHPDVPLFNIVDEHTAEMIRKDLKRAGIPYVDERGHYADFHSLRKTFITNLSRAGVSPKTAQLLARHSYINLTMNTYTMLGVCDQAMAVELLPAIPEVSAANPPDEHATIALTRSRPGRRDTAA
jgi:hypothetical protein